MSDIIKIHNLPGIDDFGKSISEFSKSYSVAVSDTERKFSIKKNNSELDWTAPQKLDRKNLTFGVFYNEINLWR